MALSQTYAIKGIYSRGPEYKSHQVKIIKLSFHLIMQMMALVD